MSFSNSSQKITINKNLLSCLCQKKDGSWVEASIDLDNHIGNKNGELVWGGKNFSHSSQDITVDYNVLRCQAKDKNGDPNDTMIDLDEKISNSNGILKHK